MNCVNMIGKTASLSLSSASVFFVKIYFICRHDRHSIILSLGILISGYLIADKSLVIAAKFLSGVAKHALHVPPLSPLLYNSIV